MIVVFRIFKYETVPIKPLFRLYTLGVWYLVVKGFIDFHVHPIKALIDPVKLLSDMDNAGIEKAVLLALDIDPNDLLKNKRIRSDFKNRVATSMVWDIESQYMLAIKMLEVGQTSNEVVYEFVDFNRNRFIGFGSINPRKGKKYVKDKLKEIIEFGFKGIKIIPTMQFFDPGKNRNVNLLWKLAYDNNLIIMAHTGCDPGPWEFLDACIHGNPERLKKLLKSYETKVVLAHMGAYSDRKPKIWFREALELANRFNHVWLDTSAVLYLFHNEKDVELIREYGVMDKVLFGSDYPVVMGLELNRAVSLIELSDYLSYKEKVGILRDNAVKLLSNH